MNKLKWKLVAGKTITATFFFLCFALHDNIRSHMICTPRSRQYSLNWINKSSFFPAPINSMTTVFLTAASTTCAHLWFANRNISHVNCDPYCSSRWLVAPDLKWQIIRALLPASYVNHRVPLDHPHTCVTSLPRKWSTFKLCLRKGTRLFTRIRIAFLFFTSTVVSTQSLRSIYTLSLCNSKVSGWNKREPR